MTLTPPRRDTDLPRHYRPPTGLPDPGDRSRLQGLLGSLFVHLLIVLILVMPYLLSGVLAVRDHRAKAAAGDGREGGGGGGTGGSGLTVEQLYWVPLTPAPEAASPAQTVPPTAPQPEITPPPRPVPEPQITPPPVPPRDTQQVTQPASPPDQEAAPVASSGAPLLGQGGGTGRDGTAGSGPGSGGGVGSGIGTGRGSGIGPGTGAGADSIHPPTLLTLTLPPLDAPPRLRPYVLIALFDVDERGNTRLIGFNETSDSRFNRQVREVLKDVRFRPAVRMDGRPVRDTGRFEIEYP